MATTLTSSSSSSSLASSSLEVDPGTKFCGSVTTALTTTINSLCTQPTAAESQAATQISDSIKSPLKKGVLYCFEQIPLTRAEIRSFSNFTNQAELNVVCQTSSCFNSNLKYFSGLWKLLEAVKYHLLTTATSSSSQTTQRRRLLSDHLSFAKQIYYEFDRQTVRKLLDQFLPYSSGQDDETRFEESISYSPDAITKLLCLKDGNGKLCAPVLSQIVVDKNFSSFQLQPCRDTCPLQIARNYGQIITDRGIQTSDPNQRFLGIFLGMYGRHYCDYDGFGQSCADKIFGTDFFDTLKTKSWATRTMGTFPGFLVQQQQPATLVAKTCKSCLTNFVGDGDCDVSCFNPACGYDFKDCFVNYMFPGVFKNLTDSLLPLDDTCHPLNPLLDPSGYKPKCAAKLQNLYQGHGCCFAVGIDILKHALDNEYFSHPLLPPRADQHARKLVFSDASRSSNVMGGWSLSTYDHYETDRSSKYAELLSGVFLNPTCDQPPQILTSNSNVENSKRNIIVIDFVTLDLYYTATYYLTPYQQRLPLSINIPLEILLPTNESSSSNFNGYVEANVPINDLASYLRRSITDVLALPVSDVFAISFWPDYVGGTGGTKCLVHLDPGKVFLKETAALLLQSTQVLQALQTAVKNWISTNPYAIQAMIQNAAQGRLIYWQRQRRRLNAPAYGEDINNGEETDSSLPFSVDDEEISIAQAQASLINYQITQTAIPATTTVAGSFDIGGLSVQESCSSSTFGLNMSSLGNGIPENLLYRIQSQDPNFDPHSKWQQSGTQVTVECAEENFEPATTSSTGSVGTGLNGGGVGSGALICAQGEWLPQNASLTKLQCARTCAPFKLDDIVANNDGLFVSGAPFTSGGLAIGTFPSGSVLNIGCSPGYVVADASPVSNSQKILCRDGQWDTVQIACQKLVMFSGTCNSVSLNPLTSNLLFSFTTTFSSSTKTWWSATCQRGYEPDFGTSPLNLMCVNDSSLLAFVTPPVPVIEALTKLSIATQTSATAVIESLTTQIDNALTNYLYSQPGTSAVVDLSKIAYGKTLKFLGNPHPELINLGCKIAIVQEPALPKNTAISDWHYIAIVFCASAIVTCGFGAWGYYWRTRGRERRARRKLAKAAAAEALEKENNVKDNKMDHSTQPPSQEPGASEGEDDQEKRHHQRHSSRRRSSSHRNDRLSQLSHGKISDLPQELIEDRDLDCSASARIA